MLGVEFGPEQEELELGPSTEYMFLTKRDR